MKKLLLAGLFILSSAAIVAGDGPFRTEEIGPYFTMLEDVLSGRDSTIVVEHNIVVVEKEWYHGYVPNAEWSGEIINIYLIRDGEIIVCDQNAIDAFLVARRFSSPGSYTEDYYRLFIFNVQRQENDVYMSFRNDIWWYALRAGLAESRSGAVTIADIPRTATMHP